MITDLDKFSTVIKYLKKLLDDRKARYFFESGNSIELVLTDQQETNSLKDELGLEQKELDFTLKVEIPALLISALSGDRSNLRFLMRIEDEDDEKEYKKNKQLIEEKLSIVSDLLVFEKMKESYLLKKTSKINFISGVDWEVNTKTFDDVEGKIPDLKYAVVRLNLSSSERISDFFPFFANFSEKNNELVLSLDINDVQNMIDIFTDINKALGGDKYE